MVERINIDANMLTWAIARAGYDVSEYAIANPRIQDWLDGTKQPTVKQLEDFSKKVYLPFGFLFLPEPPTEELPIPYFRSQGAELSTCLVLRPRLTSHSKSYFNRASYSVSTRL